MFEARGSPGEGSVAIISRIMGNGRYGDRGWAGRYRRMWVNHRQTILLSGTSPVPLTLGALGNDSLSLKLLLLYAGSVNDKTCIVQDLIQNEDADLVCVTETWQDESGGVNLPNYSPGFQVLFQPQLQGWGGRVAMVYCDTIDREFL